MTRLPKKSKLYGWQCSECDKSSDSEIDVKEKGARRSRTRHSKENEEVFTPKVKIKPVEPYPNPDPVPEQTQVSNSFNISNSFNDNANPPIVCEINNSDITDQNCYVMSGKSGKKRRRDKHRNRYSPDDGNPSKEHKRKRKKKSLDIENPNNTQRRITIKVYSYS